MSLWVYSFSWWVWFNSLQSSWVEFEFKPIWSDRVWEFDLIHFQSEFFPTLVSALFALIVHCTDKTTLFGDNSAQFSNITCQDSGGSFS